MDLTTVARVKTFLSITTSGTDALLGMLVTATSRTVENYLNRHAEKAARTEQYDLIPGQQVIFLKGYPVAASPAAVLKNDTDRGFGSGITAIDTGDYYVDLTQGVIMVDQVGLTSGAGVLQVVYTGGLASSASGVVSAFPEIALATDIQAAWLFKRKEVLGTSGVSGDGGSISFDAMTALIANAKEMLRPYRRILVGG